MTCIFTEQGSLGLKLSKFTKEQLLKEKRVLPHNDNFRYEAEVCGIQGKRFFYLFLKRKEKKEKREKFYRELLDSTTKLLVTFSFSLNSTLNCGFSLSSLFFIFFFSFLHFSSLLFPSLLFTLLSSLLFSLSFSSLFFSSLLFTSLLFTLLSSLLFSLSSSSLSFSSLHFSSLSSLLFSLSSSSLSFSSLLFTSLLFTSILTFFFIFSIHFSLIRIINGKKSICSIILSCRWY